MKLESNAAQITRRGFLTLGALGAVALIAPQGAFALDGVPADASNIIIEPIENGWRVRDISTGEMGTAPMGAWIPSRRCPTARSSLPAGTTTARSLKMVW